MRQGDSRCLEASSIVKVLVVRSKSTTKYYKVPPGKVEMYGEPPEMRAVFRALDDPQGTPGQFFVTGDFYCFQIDLHFSPVTKNCPGVP